MDPLIVVANAMLAVAALVLVPLGLPLSARARRDGGFVRPPATGWVVAAAASLLASLVVPTGRIAALLSLPWLAITVLLALFGLRRFGGRSHLRLEEIAVDVALWHLPIGAAWALAYRADLVVLGFSGTRALLTANHFHIAGFGACLVASLVGRALPLRAVVRRSIWRVATGVTLAGVLSLAIGITCSPSLERGVAVALAAAVATLGVLLSTLNPPRVLVRVLLLTSAAAAIFAMHHAARFAGVGFSRLDGDTFRRMLLEHGVVNTLGFVGCAVAAFRLWSLPSRDNLAGIPWSRLAARTRVGPHFFEDMDLVDHERPDAPRGLTDRFSDLARPGFDAGACAPAVRAFYEDTAHHWLTVRAEWTPLFHPAGLLWHALARRFGQLAIPVRDPKESGSITSRILPIKDDRDGRTSVRAWIRTHRTEAGGEGEAIYVAAYSSHAQDGVHYMNIAFPLPRSNMTSILHLSSLGREGGVRLTTRDAISIATAATVATATKASGPSPRMAPFACPSTRPSTSGPPPVMRPQVAPSWQPTTCGCSGCATFGSAILSGEKSKRGQTANTWILRCAQNDNPA